MFTFLHFEFDLCTHKRTTNEIDSFCSRENARYIQLHLISATHDDRQRRQFMVVPSEHDTSNRENQREEEKKMLQNEFH